MSPHWPAHGVSADADRPNVSLIDVHHHFIPPSYFAENRERIVAAARLRHRIVGSGCDPLYCGRPIFCTSAA
jgi:hypothetical protein